MNEENRKFIRLNKLLPIEFTFGEVGIPSYQKLVLLLYSINISGGGAMVISNLSLKENFAVKIDMTIGKKTIRNIEGIIKWNKPAKIQGLYELGIEFVNIEKEKQDEIIKFIESHSEEE